MCLYASTLNCPTALRRNIPIEGEDGCIDVEDDCRKGKDACIHAQVVTACERTCKEVYTGDCLPKKKYAAVMEGTYFQPEMTE